MLIVPNVRLLELRCTYKWGGGPDKTILLSAERHDKTRVGVTVAYIRAAKDQEFCIAEKAKTRGLDFYEIEEYNRIDFRALRRLRDLVVHKEINLIHSHDYKSDLLAYLVRRWLWYRPIKLVSTAHAWVIIGMRGEFYRRLDLMLMRRFNHLIAVSHATKAEMVAANLAIANITVIHNAIDTNEWSRARVTEDFRNDLGLHDVFPVIGYVGRIMPEKDLVTWMQVVARVAAVYPKARFILVGEGRNTETQLQLQKLATTLGIGDRVVFPGYKEELLSVYASFDVFLLTSRREGLPNSVLEAMALGLPVVTTDVAGTKELVIDGQTGFVSRQGDVQSLSQAVLRLAGEESLRISMGEAGRARVEQEFSFARRLQHIEGLYERVLGLSPSCGSTAANVSADRAIL
jgi:glycosyltransferase involved in cell wall biosynthesis